MMRKSFLLSFLIAFTSLPLLAAPQEPLGDLARRLREEQLKTGPKTTKIYTNDNLPRRKQEQEKGRREVASAPSPAAGIASEKAQAERNARHAVEEANRAAESSQPATEREKSEDKVETKEHWQARFKSVRARLADAQERQQLVEDEINLLQIQDVRALDPGAKAELRDKIKAKEEDLSQRRAITEEAQKALEDLQKEFQESGAPEEWGETKTESRE